MAGIQVLDKHTAELIAAGEVVERPSSVVKEMVENSLDAGATSITVEIKAGGISYIRITDNGAGIVREDVPKAFLRHATSKIRQPDDLDSIATLGFRGEALASIAAVTRLELLTRTGQEDFGTRYVMEGGEEVLLDDAGCPVGCTFVIRDLFYNTPARMKFLKKNVSEGNAVADVLDRLALSHPEVAFTFIRDGRQTLLTPGDGKLYSAVYAVYGKEFAASLIPVSYENAGITLHGFTSKPTAGRNNRSMQLFFVNGRFVRTGTGSAALQEAYKNAMMVGKFPAGVFHLQFPFDQIDVNVHPAKIEVRFSNERAIFDTVYYGVKSALEKGDTRPAVQLPKPEGSFRSASSSGLLKKASGAFQKPLSTVPVSPPPATPVQTKFHMVRPTEQVAMPSNRVMQDYIAEKSVPAEKQASFKPSVSGTSLDVAVEEPEVPEKPAVSCTPASAPAETATGPDAPRVRLIGEAFQTYILAEIGDRMLVIDKHAAHERILFDRLKETVPAGSAQLLLEPVTLTLRKHQYSLLMENAALLEQAGILIESFGDQVIRVQAVPMNLEGEDVRLLMEEIVEKLERGTASVTADRLDWLFHSIACRSAVKGGQHTSREELLVLAQRIAADDSVRYCPHGRPVAMWLTKSQLEKQFGRS